MVRQGREGKLRGDEKEQGGKQEKCRMGKGSLTGVEDYCKTYKDTTSDLTAWP